MDVHQFCAEIFQLHDVELSRKMEQAGKIRKVRKGEVLIHAGERQLEATFLVAGLFRGYFLDPEGKEITDCFAYRCGDFVMCCHSMNDVAHITLEALEESEIFCISFEYIHGLLQEHTEMGVLYCRMLTKSLQMHWGSKVALTRYSASQRYQWFLEEYPGVIDLVKKKYVASFLNLTPQTLSLQRKNAKEAVGG
ncbi:MAG: Crp/Fnr family transcriptional regulator [Eubacteriales bacterium]|nr:Crp/Fnr family transcriptional regulator [Eubacteriales bacterium]